VPRDLDEVNLALLRERRVHFVLHHDLKTDARTAFRTIMLHGRAPSGAVGPQLSAVVVITPYNVPE